MSEPLRTVNVGLIGLGTVGGGVARLIKSHHEIGRASWRERV